VNAIRIGAVLVLAVAAAVVANLVLLGVATGPNDPVGKLSPRAGLVQPPASTSSTPIVPTPPSADTTTTTSNDDGARRGGKQDD
jgi:hypothetical protein